MINDYRQYVNSDRVVRLHFEFINEKIYVVY